MTQVLERNEYIAPISVKGVLHLGRRDRAEISFDQTVALDPVQSLGQDLSLGARFRVFTELESGFEQGRNGGPRPTDRDPLDLHQAFLDWKVVRSEARSVTLRFGRQELGFGSGRLIAPAEGLNLRRSMDGVRVTFQSGKRVWNASALRLVENRAGILDNVPDHNQSFWGAGFTVPGPF